MLDRPLRNAAGLIALLSVASPARAQEITLTSPLAAAPVGRKLWREGRFELAPELVGELAAHERPELLGGGAVSYYPLDRWGAGLWAAGRLPLSSRRDSELDAVLSPELVGVPLSRKVALFQSLYFPYNLQIAAGPAWFNARHAAETQAHWGATLGGGVTAFCASFLSFALDYRLLVGGELRHTLSLSVGYWPQERRWAD